MHPPPYPTHRHPEPALHLLGGIWIASCPTCGFQLTRAQRQLRSRPPGRVPGPSASRAPVQRPPARASRRALRPDHDRHASRPSRRQPAGRRPGTPTVIGAVPLPRPDRSVRAPPRVGSHPGHGRHPRPADIGPSCRPWPGPWRSTPRCSASGCSPVGSAAAGARRTPHRTAPHRAGRPAGSVSMRSSLRVSMPS